MPLQYKPTKHAFHFDEEDVQTEPEHQDSCDINKMIGAIHRGQMVRGGPAPQYGYDDTTMDGVQFRIEKQRLEEELSEIAEKHELEEEIANQIPPDVRKKFGFKTKKPNSSAKNDDDKTTTKKADSAPKQNEPEKTSTPPKEE